MSSFSELATGGTKLGGCATTTYVKTYSTSFAEGETAYNIHKAKKGILEKVVIKKLKVINRQLIGGLFGVMYIDTLNGLWNESDLINHSDAVEIAIAHYEDLLEQIENLKVC